MSVRIIARKIKEPLLPYNNVKREQVISVLNTAFEQQKQFVYLSSLNGFGKTVAVNQFLQDVNKNHKCWYILDEWDKDPVTFINYIYNSFKFRKLISNDLQELLTQPLNSEQQIKNFIGLLSNELEFSLEKTTYLIFDNFQEVQNEVLIKQIIINLLNYCPEHLKIIFISQEKMPEEFYSYYMKQELMDIKPNELLLSEDEALKILELNNRSKNIKNELLTLSQKCISLFVLLSNEYSEKEALESYYNNPLLKNAIEQTTNQIYYKLSEEAKNFVHQTIFLPKLNMKVFKSIFKENYNDIIQKLLEIDLLTQDNNNEYSYNVSFLPILKESFYKLDQIKKEEYIDNILKLLNREDSETLLSVLLRAKVYKKVVQYLEENYEYYFRNFLYDTVERILNEIRDKVDDNIFILYIRIRLLRSTHRVNEVIKLLNSLSPEQKSLNIKLEEGICEVLRGHYNQSIEKLSLLETDDLELNNYIALNNCLGVAYMQLHNLDKALEHFKKAINIKDKTTYQHDFVKIYHNIGLTYTWLGDFDEAVNAYEQALYLSRKYNIILPAMTFHNLAVINNLQGDYDKAYHNSLSGLEIANKIDSKIDKFYIYLTLSESYRGNKNSLKIKESIDFLDQNYKNNLNPIQDALLLKLKAHIETDNNNFDLAKEYINKAINIRKLLDGDPSLIEYKIELAEIDYYSGNYHNALSIYSEIEEDLFNEKHYYHLAKVYLFKALCNKELNDNINFKKAFKNAKDLIKEKNYKFLDEKLNNIDENESLPIKDTLKTEEVKFPNKNISDNALIINTFGQLSIRRGDKEVSKKDWAGKKTRLLMTYLLLNKTGVSKEQIFENLFPESENPSSAFHVNMNRLRKALSSVFKDTDVFQFNNDLYSFNFSINYEWDASTFEYLLSNSSQENDINKKYDFIENALKLYQGHFMQGFEIESWVFSTQEYYKQLAYKSFSEICNYYLEEKNYNKVLELSDKFFNLDNCYEDACMYKIKALISLNRKQEALKQYKVLENSLMKILFDEPSQEMKDFITKIK